MYELDERAFGLVFLIVLSQETSVGNLDLHPVVRPDCE